MAEHSEQETHSFFGHVATLSIEERNGLDEYLHGLPEFNEWDEAGFVLGVKQKLLKAAISSGATDKCRFEAEEIEPSFFEFVVQTGERRQGLPSVYWICPDSPNAVESSAY